MCIATDQLNYNLTTKQNGGMNAASQSRLRPMLPLILCGYVFNTALYFGTEVFLPYTGWNFTPVSQHCPVDNPSCTRTDLFAFQIVSLLNLTYLGVLGLYAHYGSKKKTPKYTQGRMFGYLIEADYVNLGIIVFQGWDFIASIFFEEHCTMIMMTHHLLAFICGLYSLEYGVR